MIKRLTYTDYTEFEKALAVYRENNYRIIAHADPNKKEYWIEAEPTTLTPKSKT